ncbi:SufE family protein [Oceanicella sp. SM1341]|uniref:SufE family protein n=1 Tax=Oceanicella sp. SM1341 TaxID=1548889 RepID=UPI000E4D1052|nr:SufE family protein [Oceanicella sp. SM1341]
MAAAEFEEIVETFEFLEDWEDRYRHVIDLGREMDPLPEELHTEGAKVHGCASQVWMIPRVQGEGPEAVISFDGDSDALIVRGLIAVLRTRVNGETADTLSTLDITGELARLGLDKHLSAQRSNGLRAMVARVREIAESTARG